MCVCCVVMLYLYSSGVYTVFILCLFPSGVLYGSVSLYGNVVCIFRKYCVRYFVW